MPAIVPSVPNPWQVYQDGNIWEFTQDEFNAMPKYSPVTGEDGRIIGKNMMYWPVNGLIYVRFYNDSDIANHPHNWPEHLANWV